MRIIDTDNYGGDYPNERFWFGRLTSWKAEELCKELNRIKPLGEDRYFQVVRDDYTLQPGFEP